MKKIVVFFYLILFSIPIQLYAQDQIKNFIHKNNIRPKTYEKIATILDQNRISYQPTELWNVVSDTLTNSQSLLSYRISEEQISNKKMNEQRLATERILHETLCYLIDHNRSNCPKLSKVYESLKDLQEREMISFMDILQVFHKIIYTNRNRLTLS